MKRPAQRGQNKQFNRCSVCRRTGHRIESCPHPAAATIKDLRTELESLRKTKPAMKVLRKEFKTRKSAKQSGDHHKRASEAYMKKPAARKPSPAEVRRRLCHDPDLQIPDSEEAAAAWLLDHGWAAQPDECSGCGGARFSDLVFPARDVLHWRCLGCGKREGLVQSTIFRGLRCGCVQLVRLIVHYVRADLTHAPRVTDVVQACHVGRTVAEHFLNSLRYLESQAGLRWCKDARMKGLVCFRVV